MGLKPMVTATEIEDIAWEGIEKFPPDAELYVRPLFYSEDEAEALRQPALDEWLRAFAK